MENFNPKEYRDKEAKLLKDLRKIDEKNDTGEHLGALGKTVADITLEQDKKTPEYQKAKEAHQQNVKKSE